MTFHHIPASTSAGCPAFPFAPADDPTAPALTPPGYEHETIFKVRLPDGRPDTWAWWVADHATAQRVYRDDTTFQRGTADGVQPYLRLAPLILTQDGQHHKKIRSLVNRQFTKPRIARFRPRIEAIATRRLDVLISQGEPGDLVETLAWPLSLHAIAELLGVPGEGRDQFRVWGDMLLSTGHDREADNQAAMTQMTTYAARLMSQHHGTGNDNVVSAALANAQRLDVDPQEAAMLIASLVVAGWETTAAAISATVFKLLTTPHIADTTLYRHLCEHPELIPTAVEEMLRIIPNSWLDTGQPRRATRDTELAGTTIQAGDLVLVAHDVADRDPAVFDNPTEIDLARLELNITLELLTCRMPDLKLATHPTAVTWNTTTPIRRPDALPVTWST
jgi:nocardicin N-oxygenase